MSKSDEHDTLRDLRFGIAAELAAAGFDGAEEIGRGGFGVVCRCVELSLDRTVAVKVLTSEIHGAERARFLREQQALGRLSGHPYIVEVHQVDITSTGKPFIVMPFYAHGSLDAQLRTAGPLGWRDVLSIAVKLADALAVAHANDIVHQDVKPANVLVTDYGQPVLADFGIARRGSEFRTEVFAGTPAFTAPEVLSGETPQAGSDIYSLGATLFSLVTGQATDERGQLRELGIPPEMSAAIEQAMAIDPADRYASAAEFGERCREVQSRYGQNVDAPLTLSPGRTADYRSAGSAPAPDYRSAGSAPAPDYRSAGSAPAPDYRSAGSAPATASTKFRPPTPPRSLVERPRLLRILRQGEPRRLALIHAPAGFGKSTLAAQWGHSLEAGGMSMAWLTVDTDDDNVVWFLMHLVETIRRVRPELVQDLRATLEQRSGSSVRYVITALIDEIHDSGSPVVLVIDNWHRVTSRATIDAMGYLIEHGCHHLRLVVTSRSRVGLPLSKMSVDDEFVEIDSTALRFDTAEAQSFLVDVNGLSLAGPDVSMLQESTQGWVAALQLASLSLRGRDNPAEFIGRLSAHHHSIGEYLADNVLDQVDAPLLDFLLSTCVTEKICGDLATALSGVASGQETLEHVSEQDLFLRRAEDEEDDGREWFRYHPLFSEYLRERLARLDSDRTAELHRIASTWFADHGLLNEAVDQALAAREPERAMRFVLDHATELLEGSRMATFLGLVAKLPQATSVANPRLQLSVAWTTLAIQRHDETRAALDHVDAALNADSSDPQTNFSLRFEAAVARAAEQFLVDRFDPLPDLVIEHLDDDSTSFAANAAVSMAALSALNRFDFDEVRRRQQRTATYQQHSKGPLVVMYGHCLVGLAAYEQLDIPAAETSFRTAHLLARKSGTRSHAALVAGALLGGLLYQKGRLDDAETLLDEGLEVGAEGGSVEALLAGYGIGARIKAVRGDLAAAEDRLAAGAKIAENLALSRFAARIVNERIRCGLPITGDERTRLLSLAPYRRLQDGAKAMASELEQDSAIRLLLADNAQGAIESACARVDCMTREVGTQNRPRVLLQTQLMRIACLSAAGRLEEALFSIGSVLAQCAEHGLTRLVVDTGPGLRPVIAAFQDNTGPAGRIPPMFTRRIMAAFDQADHRLGRSLRRLRS